MLRYYHLRDDNRVPFATLAVEDWGVGVAICSSKDRFSKSRGRDIAFGRLVSGKPHNYCGREVVVQGNTVSVDKAIYDKIWWIQRKVSV